MATNSEPDKYMPVACTLSDAERGSREATLLSEFRKDVTAVEELPNGYAFHIRGDQERLMLIGELIALERECCQFLTFQLVAEPKLGPVVLSLTGPEGTKQFLEAAFLQRSR